MWQFAVVALSALLIVFARSHGASSRRRAARIWVGGAMLFAAAVIVTAEVLLRKGAAPCSAPASCSPGSDEISGYLFAVGTSLFAGLCAGDARPRAHRRALRPLRPAARAAMLDLVALLVLGDLRRGAARAGARRGDRPATSSRSARIRSCAFRWPGRRSHGSSASRCSSSPILRRADPLRRRHAAKGDYATVNGDRRRGDAGRGDRERAQGPRHASQDAGSGRHRAMLATTLLLLLVPARDQRAGRRRHGRARPGAQRLLRRRCRCSAPWARSSGTRRASTS